MVLIDILELFEILLHRDEEAFHVEETRKKKVWDSIDEEFKGKEKDNKKRCLEMQRLTKKLQKEGNKQ